MRQRRLWLGWAGVGFAAAMVLGACGGGGGSSGTDTSSSGSGATAAGIEGSSDTPDPCTLLTVAEVSAALESPIEPPDGRVLTSWVGGRQCLFSTGGLPIKMVQIEVRTNGDFNTRLRAQGQSVDRLYDDTKNFVDAANVEDVSGLGDRAYRTAGTYRVLKDGVALEVNLGLDTDPSPQDQAGLRSLVEVAVSRL